MGLGNRLHGKLVSFKGNRSIICPKCGRDFDKYKLVEDGDKQTKVCPHCDFIIPKNLIEEEE